MINHTTVINWTDLIFDKVLHDNRNDAIRKEFQELMENFGNKSSAESVGLLIRRNMG